MRTTHPTVPETNSTAPPEKQAALDRAQSVENLCQASDALFRDFEENHELWNSKLHEAHLNICSVIARRLGVEELGLSSALKKRIEAQNGKQSSDMGGLPNRLPQSLQSADRKGTRASRSTDDRAEEETPA